MKQLIIFVFIVLQGLLAFAQKEKKDIHEGNKLYQQKKYAEAEASYRQSVEKTERSIEGNFNLGDALYKQKKFDNAAQKFTDIASSSKDKAVKAKAYHNLGNTLLESQKLEESIAAYKKSLINNPKDDETRYNLAYAQEKLKQQQQNKDNKDQDKNKDKNKDQKNKDQDKQDKNNQNKDKDKQDQDQRDKDNQEKNQQDNKQDKQDNQNEEKSQPDKLSKEDAERMLEALNHEEKNTQEKLKNKKAKGVKGRITKDW